MRAPRLAAALTVAALALAGCTAGPDQAPTSPSAPRPGGASGSPVLAPDAVAEATRALPQHDGLDLKTTRLAEGLLPPTNRWFSGLAFGDTPQPVFPLPYVFSLAEEGFGFGVPVVVTTGQTIMGSNDPALDLVLPQRPSWQVSAYDEASVTVTDTVSGGAVTIAQGSPYVWFTAGEETTLSAAGAGWRAEGDVWRTKLGNDEYALVGEGLEVSGDDVTVPAGARATWFVLPAGGDAVRLAELAVPLEGTSAHWSVDDQARTRLVYATEGGRPTAIAALPHHTAGGASGCELGTYPSIFGTLALCEGTELAWTAPLYEARAGLDLSGLADAEREELATQLAADVASAQPHPADTYFGGKALYRDAQLWHIARQLGATEQEQVLRERLVSTLDRWMDPDGCATGDAFCFTYDTTNRGIVGRTPSFGSDEFNDHHFHYGYFLYAGGVLAAEEPELAERWAPVMDLLAADIAASPASDLYPERRTFDVYASHSWASGTSPFADGNNQESSSEAVNAWAGLNLWARARGNAPLADHARWMHALEAQAARAYWTDFDRADPVYEGLSHTILPLNFGGKRDYATWFSAEPAAALAILIIPASPSSDHLAGDPERIRANVAEATATRGFDQQYGDYLLMYAALAGEEDRAEALATAREVSDEAIDDGSTRTYLLAFLMSAAS